jgi:signal transduction histidine kinase
MTSIRARLAGGLLASSALVLGAGGAALYFATKAGLERRDDALLLSRAWALAASVRMDESELLFEPPPALSADLERAGAGFEIRLADGVLFASSAHGAEAEVELAHAREPAFAWITAPDGEPAREVALRIPVPSEDGDHPVAIARTQADGELAAVHEESRASERSAPSSKSERATPRIASERVESRSPLDGSSGAESAAQERSSIFSTVHASAPLTSSIAHDDLSIRAFAAVPETRATLARLRSTIAVVIAIAIATSFALVRFVLRRGLAPLDTMAAEAQSIDERSLDRRFANGALPAELEPIRTRLNDLLERLERSFDRERRFNAAVAHELRTPIAELRALSEIALRWPESADAEKNMADVSAVAQEMQSVVDALLTLRRVESGAESIELEPVRVDEIVRATIGAYDKAAAARNQTLKVKLAAGMTIDSHPHMLRSIISNLVSNAIEYAPEGSTIEIACRVESDRFTLSTRNPAPDLTPEDVQHLFEPFWRKDAVRTTGSHAGLGLTLTDSLAKALGCTLSARLDSGGKLSIEIAGAPLHRDPEGSITDPAPKDETAHERVELGHTPS